jgi:hypothetical protein
MIPNLIENPVPFFGGMFEEPQTENPPGMDGCERPPIFLVPGV